MTFLRRVDDALLDVAGGAAGLLRDLTGVDQWDCARTLARAFVLLGAAAQWAMFVERGFAAGNVLILGVWVWHYRVAAAGIERYARLSDGSARARLAERPSRSMYAPLLACLAAIVAASGVHASGALMLGAFVAMASAHYVKACDMPPPRRRTLRTAIAAG
jgi:hypothetical protein